MRSKLFITIFIAVAVAPAPLSADHAINVNTASLEELMELDGVGASVGQSIIDNRPYASIEEVSRASGIGEPGSVSYEKIQGHITVGAPPAETQEQPQTETQTQTQASEAASGQSGIPPPPMMARVAGSERVVVGAGSFFDGSAYGSTGEPLLANVRYIWNFGDGGTAEGKRVFHVYSYPGTYRVQLSIAYNYSSASTKMVVEAVPGSILLTAHNDGSLLLWNSSQQDVDVGWWSLAQGATQFVIPEGTMIFAGEGVRFAPRITGIVATAGTAKLLYPNGAEAVAAVPSTDSPLRGERVVGQGASAAGIAGEGASERDGARLSDSPKGEYAYPEPADSGVGLSSPLEHTNLAAAAGGAPTAWWVWGALAAVLGVGVAGAYYAQAAKKHETSPLAEEFELDNE